MQTAGPFSFGVATIGTTRAALAGSFTPLNTGITIKAPSGNSGTVYIGDSTVTTSNGYPLAAGDSVQVPASDLANVYAVASGAGQPIRFIGG